MVTLKIYHAKLFLMWTQKNLNYMQLVFYFYYTALVWASCVKFMSKIKKHRMATMKIYYIKYSGLGF